MSFSLPPLFVAADKASNKKQRLYLRLVRAEYIILFISACLSLSRSESREFVSVYALVFVAALAALAWRAHSKPEQAWYKCRALAESVKTLSWRFSMRSAPYDDELVADARTDFRSNLTDLISTNTELGSSLADFNQGGPQVTESMVALRASSLDSRRAEYLKHRVDSQRVWYQNKSRKNARAARGWIALAVFAYVLAIGFVIAPLYSSTLTSLPLEPLIVAASAVLGWTQTKKYNELASSYALTAQEIGIAQGHIEDAAGEADFSKAVNEVELVFSREHTQWIARQAS